MACAPVISTSEPHMNAASSEARKATRAATSGIANAPERYQAIQIGNGAARAQYTGFEHWRVNLTRTHAIARALCGA